MFYFIVHIYDVFSHIEIAKTIPLGFKAECIYLRYNTYGQIITIIKLVRYLLLHVVIIFMCGRKQNI